MTFTIQYVSDLHLEFYSSGDFKRALTPAAPYLALAGDIGYPNKTLFVRFLEYVSSNWKMVFYIPGNHEYYDLHVNKVKYKHRFGESYSTRQAIIHELTSAFHNIKYLNSSDPTYYFEDHNIALIGLTLWTHIPDSMPIDAMNDFSMITYEYVDNKPVYWTPDIQNRIYERERAMLGAQIDYWTARESRIIVMTHHMPSYELIDPKYASSPLNPAFASECTDLLTPALKVWIYGHTHTASDRVLNNTRFVCNPGGYPGETTGHNPTATITIESETDTKYNHSLATV
jgi:hypothetical protein